MDERALRRLAWGGGALCVLSVLVALLGFMRASAAEASCRERPGVFCGGSESFEAWFYLSAGGLLFVLSLALIAWAVLAKPRS